MAEMRSPLFDLSQVDLQAEINSYTLGAGQAWPTLFPLKYTSSLEIKSLEGDESIPVNADLIAFNSKSPTKKRKTVGKWSGTIGKISISRDKDEIQIKEYNTLKLLAQNNSNPAVANQLVDMVYEDVEFVDKGIDGKTEQLAMIAGSTGMVALNEKNNNGNVLQEAVNYNIPENHKTGVTVKWSNHESADPIGDVALWQQNIANEGKTKPMYCILENKAFKHVLLCKSVLQKVAPAILLATGLANQDNVTLQMVNNYMQSQGYPQFVVIDTYTKTELRDGTQITEKPWKENVAVLSPTIQLGWTYWSDVPRVENTDALQVYSNHKKFTRYSELNPMLEVTMAESYMFPALINRRSLVYINTENTTWGDGEEQVAAKSYKKS